MSYYSLRKFNNYDSRKSLEKNYTILAYHEIWEWLEFRNDLFADYVRIFHRVKTCATGYPKNITTDKEKEAFREEYYQAMGGEKIRDEEMIDNPSYRLVGKLFLNVSCKPKSLLFLLIK